MNISKKWPLSVLLMLLFFWSKGFATEVIPVNKELAGKYLGKYIEYLEDKEGKLNFSQVSSKQFSNQFMQGAGDVLFFGITHLTHWLKVSVKNEDGGSDWLLLLDFLQNEYIDVYDLESGDTSPIFQTGFLRPFSTKTLSTCIPYAFPIKFGKNVTHTFFIRIVSDRTKIIPLTFKKSEVVWQEESSHNLGYGIYFGILFGLLLYNLFLFFGLRDKAYLYYILSVLSSIMVFSTTSGHVFHYILPNHPYLGRMLIELGSAFLAVFAALFALNFLKIKEYSKWLAKILQFMVAVGLLSVPLMFLIDVIIIQAILYNLLSLLIPVLLISGIVSYRRGNRYAGFYIIAWLGYMIGGILILFRDQSILPFNFLTTHGVEIGSAMEVILLSLALSKRYQLFKKEKEEATLYALKVTKEANENLEQKVHERTIKLEETLTNLKETQVELVQAEKMASLGQLTAGVAHEINNPINFISGSISPLRRDINDLVQVITQYESLIPEDKKSQVEQIKKNTDYIFAIKEIDTLLSGIQGGTDRTAEIVKNLRSFTRLDEQDKKKVDIHEGLNATLSILSDRLGNRITIDKDYGVLPEVYCSARNINQVFEIVLMNAIQSINGLGLISIKTYVKENSICISISDSGVGIPSTNMNKIFEPFFTTRDVGGGKGLGLSTAYSIIHQHNGSIEVESEVGKGSTFIISLPVAGSIEL